jgi:hypothetical protein
MPEKIEVDLVIQKVQKVFQAAFAERKITFTVKG